MGSAQALGFPRTRFRQNQIQRDGPDFASNPECGGSCFHLGRPVVGVPASALIVDRLRIVEPLQHPVPVGSERPQPSLTPSRTTEVVRVPGSDVTAARAAGIQAHRPLRAGAPCLESHRNESSTDEQLASLHRVVPHVYEHERIGESVIRTQPGIGLYLVGLCIGAPVLEPHRPPRAKHPLINFLSHGRRPKRRESRKSRSGA